MKVTLDLTQLLEDGKITQEEHDKLLALSSSGTSSLALNLLIAFGVIAVAGGILALVPNEITGIILGGGLLATGLALYQAETDRWSVLANICVLTGALVLSGGIIVLTDASTAAFLAITAGCAALGIIARSGLLVGLSVLSLSSSIGARTGYAHATYFLGIEEPFWTIILFSGVALACYLASKRLPTAYERLAIIASRTSLFLVNFGFWIGSLWGDKLGKSGPEIPDVAFGILWAIGLIGLAIWAVRANRRWVVNTAAVFGAIHFYTQWFEYLGAHPASVLLCGLVTLGLALGLWKLNQNLMETGGEGTEN